MKRRTPTVRQSVEALAKAVGGTIAHLNDKSHPRPPWESDPHRNWPDGSYECHCGTCLLGFIGPKGSVTCKACRTKWQREVKKLTKSKDA